MSLLEHLATVAHAANGTDFKLTNPLGATSFTDLVQKLADALVQLAIPVAVIMYIWAGFNLLTSAGNPTKITKGKQIMLWTSVGLAIIFIGGGFVSLIKDIISGGTGSPASQVQTIPSSGRTFNQLTP